MRFFTMFCGLAFGLLLLGTVMDIPESFGEICSTKRVLLNHEITNGSVTSMCIDSDSNSLIVNIIASGMGSMTMEFPLLSDTNCGTYFFILLDGSEIAYTESIDEFSNIITFDFTSHSKVVEIIGSGWNHYDSCDLIHNLESVHWSFKEQISMGVQPLDIICNDDQKLIFRTYDNSTSCVFFNTMNKLIEREPFLNPFEHFVKIYDTYFPLDEHIPVEYQLLNLIFPEHVECPTDMILLLNSSDTEEPLCVSDKQRNHLINSDQAVEVHELIFDSDRKMTYAIINGKLLPDIIHATDNFGDIYTIKVDMNEAGMIVLIYDKVAYNMRPSIFVDGIKSTYSIEDVRGEFIKKTISLSEQDKRINIKYFNDK